MQKDFFHIPSKYSGDVKIYTSNTGADLKGFQIWQKPKGASLVSMTIMSGGGGGGGGFSRTAGSPGGGGGGGASSPVARLLCAAMLLPDVLYIQVGAGGQGGEASLPGAAGLVSYILTSKTAATPNIILYSSASAPGGGNPGTAAAGGTGGTAPGTPANQPTNSWGFYFATQGVLGADGGPQTGGTSSSISGFVNRVTGEGTGGAGCQTTDFAGGQITCPAVLDTSNLFYPAVSGVVAPGGAAGGGNGGSGVCRITPLFNTGGSGGGSNNSSLAGKGGNGGYGSGGGGGGAGTSGGRGGNGGSGLVVIVTI